MAPHSTAGATNSGAYHTTATVGAGYLDFNAYPDPVNDPSDYCFMTFSIDNSTGVVTPGAVRRGPNATHVNCSVFVTGGNVVTFRASHN